MDETDQEAISWERKLPHLHLDSKGLMSASIMIPMSHRRGGLRLEHHCSLNGFAPQAGKLATLYQKQPAQEDHKYKKHSLTPQKSNTFMGVVVIIVFN